MLQALSIPVLTGLELHVAMHFAIILLALIMFAVSTIAYFRNRGRRLLYVCAAFFLFALKELLTYFETFYFLPWMFVPVIQAPITHILALLILLFFFIAVFERRR